MSTDLAESVLSQTRRFLDYLAALSRELQARPVRDVRDLGELVLPADVPQHPRVLVGPGEKRSTWLTLPRLDAPTPPDLPAALRDRVAPTSLVDFVDGPQLVDVDGDGPPLGSASDEGLEEVRAELARWRVEQWQPWAEQADSVVAARTLYQRLYRTRLRVERDAATHELFWGHAPLLWRTGGHSVAFPILITPVSIEIGEADGTISVVPSGDPELELGALEGLGIPTLDALTKLRDDLRTRPPQLWDDPDYDAVRHRIIAPLGVDALLAESRSLPPPMEVPVLESGWVLAVRPRPARHDRFYQELSEVLGETGFMPESIAAVVSPDEELRQALDALGQSDASDWVPSGRRLLMPLEVNEEQERIARQLATSRGVTVQGPPGTGKTHTIANLICHLIAHGKRVLVTAQNEQALSVLREKIPAEMRDLSVAVLGSSPVAMDQLRASAQTIRDAIAGVDANREARRIDELGTRLDAVREDQRRADLALIEALRAEGAEFILSDGPANAPAVAAWLADHADSLGKIPDLLRTSNPIPLSEYEFHEFFKLSRRIAPADSVAVAQARPAPRSLPAAADLAEKHDRLDRLSAALSELEDAGIELEAVDAATVTELNDLARSCRGAAERMRTLEDPWLRTICQEAMSSPDAAAYWQSQLSELRTQVGRLVQLSLPLAGHDVTAPEGDHRDQLDVLDALADRFRQGKSVPRLGGREMRELHERIRVDGLPLRAEYEVKVAQAAIRLRVERMALRTRLDNLSRQVDMPAPREGVAFIADIQRIIDRLSNALAWELRDRVELADGLRSILRDREVTRDATSLKTAGGLIDSAARRKEERALTVLLQELRGELIAGEGLPNSSPLWPRLTTSLSSRDWASWDEARDEALRLESLTPSVRRRDELASRLAAQAPSWARAIVDSRADLALCGAPEVAQAMWNWRQAQTWLLEIHQGPSLDRRFRDAEALRGETKDLVIEIARRSAVLGMKKNLRHAQSVALSAYIEAIERFGGGGGKHAATWAAAARKQLPIAMGAVPVWIMPIHRVIENFDPRQSDLFDVVIVDESSQCDLLSVGVLALGRKAVVVGDDKQTSPAAVGIERQRIFTLQDAYIPDVPTKTFLTVDESLYSVAERAFPSVVLLREHFRCMPEIIGFSNRFYDNRILPLRERPRGRDLGAPLRAVRVTEGACTGSDSNRVNRSEAQALVRQLLACTGDQAYDGLTFGVVTLQGNGQGKLIENLLLESVGIEEYQRRKLRVGGPASFQGDERDVVFVSVVADDNRYAATRVGDKQRVNVAASRAAEQLWVFYTVDPSTLHADDQRRALIEYTRDTADRTREVEELSARCESEFERRVLRDITDRGYRVRVQHPVGHYRIDLVVVGSAGRLAVECDGDRFHGPEQWESDIRRQRVLERLGWKFWRILASEYNRDPGAAMEPLWLRLASLDITPTRTEESRLTAIAPSVPRSKDEPAVDRPEPWRGDIPPNSQPEGAGSFSISLPAEQPAVMDDHGHNHGLVTAAKASTTGSPSSAVRNPDSATHAAPLRRNPATSTKPLVAGANRAGVNAAAPPQRRARPSGTGPTPTQDVGRERTGDPVRTAPVSVAVPSGYRQVGWIRPHEAHAALRAYETESDQAVVDENGARVGWARYHASDSPEARRYRANVELQRTRRGGDRTVAWLRPEEAHAITRADIERRDQIITRPNGTGLLVQYFPADSPEAKTFRSVTRLHRRVH